jgi:riboflavin biosynthesis pyrimidine reductase
MDFRQLFPEPGTTDIETLVAGLRLADRAPDARPFTVANFVSSVDGRAAVQGRSGVLGDEGDLAVFRALRREVDAVLVGTGTLRAERYGRLIKDARARARRRERGLAPEPLVCVMTRTGRVPLDIPLFAEPEARVVVFTGAPLDTSAVAAEVEVVELDPAELTFATALGRLRQDHGVRALLCEGGPGVFGALLHERVVDQLFLTFAAKLAAGENPTITSGPELHQPAELVLESVLERAGSLFLRYAISN